MCKLMTKTCSKCGETKPLDEFHKHKGHKDDKRAECKECNNNQSKNYYQEHREERLSYRKDYYENGGGREMRGHLSMYENKLCSAYLGVVIAERLCRHLFKDVEVMPNNNSGFDIICNKGKKIDVKSGCVTLDKGKYPCWQFTISQNTIADYFICVAFDNLFNINPLHLWMIPGKELNHQGSAQISPSTLHKWDKWKRDIDDAQLCCAEIKKFEYRKMEEK